MRLERGEMRKEKTEEREMISLNMIPIGPEPSFLQSWTCGAWKLPETLAVVTQCPPHTTPPPNSYTLKFCRWEKLYDAMKIKFLINSQKTYISVAMNLAGHLTTPTFHFQTRSKSWPWCFQSSFYFCPIWNSVLEKSLVQSLRASERQSQARSKVSWGIIKIFIASSGWSGLWGCLFRGLMQAPISLSCPMFLQTSLQFCPVFKFSLADQVSLYKIS